MNNGDKQMTEWEVELAISSDFGGKFRGLLLLNVSAENQDGAIAIAKERAGDMLSNRFVVDCNGATKIG